MHVSSVFIQISPFTLDVTTNKYLYSAAGNAKIYLKNYISSIIPSLTLLTKSFIQTCNHSYTVHFFKSIDTILSLPLKPFLRLLGHFLFLLGPYFSFFFSLSLSLSFSLSGDHLFNYFPQFVGLHPSVTTGLISGRAYLGVPAIKSAVPMSPHLRVNLLVPVPAATYNTCSAHN